MKIFNTIREFFWPLLENSQEQETTVKDEEIEINKSRVQEVFKNIYDCYKEEEERRKTVESKSSLFIGTITVAGSIVIGATSNFIKGDKFDLWTFLLILLLVILTLYITRTIWFSIKALERKTYYSVSSTDYFNKDQKQLIKEVIAGIKKNEKVTNEKVDNMTLAQEYFKRAIIVIASYSLAILLFFTFKSFSKNDTVKNEPNQFEVSQIDQAALLNKSVRFFKEKDNFNLNEFANEVMEQPEVIERFNQYKSAWQQEHEIDIPDDFTISDSAVKKQARIFKSVIKLDKNFHIYVHGNSDLIQQGTDENGKFYKIYYKEEN